MNRPTQDDKRRPIDRLEQSIRRIGQLRGTVLMTAMCLRFQRATVEDAAEAMELISEVLDCQHAETRAIIEALIDARRTAEGSGDECRSFQTPQHRQAARASGSRATPPGPNVRRLPARP